jgi:hypothetical protein
MSATSFDPPDSGSSTTWKLRLSSQPTAGSSPTVTPLFASSCCRSGVAELQRCADLVAELVVGGRDRFEVGARVVVALRARPDREDGAAGRHDLDAGDVDGFEDVHGLDSAAASGRGS